MIPLILPVGISKWQKQLFRDFKSENVLINLDEYIKLTDFGRAIGNVISDKDFVFFWGTPEHLASETSNPLF